MPIEDPLPGEPRRRRPAPLQPSPGLALPGGSGHPTGPGPEEPGHTDPPPHGRRGKRNGQPPLPPTPPAIRLLLVGGGILLVAYAAWLCYRGIGTHAGVPQAVAIALAVLGALLLYIGAYDARLKGATFPKGSVDFRYPGPAVDREWNRFRNTEAQGPRLIAALDRFQDERSAYRVRFRRRLVAELSAGVQARAKPWTVAEGLRLGLYRFDAVVGLTDTASVALVELFIADDMWTGGEFLRAINTAARAGLPIKGVVVVAGNSQGHGAANLREGIRDAQGTLREPGLAERVRLLSFSGELSRDTLLAALEAVAALPGRVFGALPTEPAPPPPQAAPPAPG